MLTELQDRTITADCRKSDNVDALSTALSGLSTVDEAHPDSSPRTSAPDATLPHLSKPAVRRRESASQDANAELRAERVATKNDSSMFISDDRILYLGSSGLSWISWHVLKCITLGSGIPNYLIYFE